MLGFTPFYPTQKITGVSALMRYIFSPLLAPPSIPPQRREEKDKLLILEGVGGGVLVPHNIGKCCISLYHRLLCKCFAPTTVLFPFPKQWPIPL